MSWSAAAGVLGSVGSWFGAERQADEMHRAAGRQMDFQRQMSDTAHQREVKDLRAAGLNPILSMGGRGASSPPGAMAGVPDYARAATGGISTAVQARAASAKVKIDEAKARVGKVDAALTEDMYDVYESDPVLKKGTLGGMLGKRAGAPTGVGAAIGATSGWVQSMKDKSAGFVDKVLEGTEKRHYERLNRPLKKVYPGKSVPRYRGITGGYRRPEWELKK